MEDYVPFLIVAVVLIGGIILVGYSLTKPSDNVVTQCSTNNYSYTVVKTCTTTRFVTTNSISTLCTTIRTDP